MEDERGISKSQLLINEIKNKKSLIDTGKPNPLALLMQSKTQINKTMNEIEENIKDANKLVLINVSDIVPLISNGTIMHNRSAMATKDKDEIIKFSESLKLAQKDNAGLFGTGLINAITVRESTTEIGKYELISGYRRTEAFKILEIKQIPAFIIICDDKVARRLRNAENKQRRDVNAYDETYGELEEIQLYCDFSTLDETEKALRKAKRIIDVETQILKDIDRSSPTFNYSNFIDEKSKYSLEEHEKANFLKDVVYEMSQRQLNTFVNRLEILEVSEKIKGYMYENAISYSEASSLKKILKDNDELIDDAVKYLLDSEKDSKRLSTKEFEKYLKNMIGYKNQNRGYKENIFSKLKGNITSIEKSKTLNEKDLEIITQKIQEINTLIENCIVEKS